MPARLMRLWIPLIVLLVVTIFVLRFGSVRTPQPRLTLVKAALSSPLLLADASATVRHPTPPSGLQPGSSAEYIVSAPDDGAAGEKHLRGVTSLTQGYMDAAISQLSGATEENPSNAHAWSDLAAARLARATRHDRPSELPAALVAADRAIGLEPRFAPARFNRASVVEAMGFGREAARAWRDFLRTHTGDEWRDAGLRHLHRLNAPTSADAWLAVRRHLDRASDAELSRMTQIAPDRLRPWGEVVVLAAWGRACLNGDPATAQDQLTLGHRIAFALQKTSGDRLLLDITGRIERSTARDRMKLAAAHVVYENARAAISAGRYEAAADYATECMRDFARLDSPAEALCQLSRGIALHSLQRNDEALRVFTDLRRTQAASEINHASLLAQVYWHMGLLESLRGHWSAALDACTRSYAHHMRIGDRLFAGRVQTMISEIYDLLGQTELAWAHRTAAARLSWQAGDVRSLHTTAASATFAAIAAQDWMTARSLVAIDRGLATDVEPDLIARCHLREALIELRLGNREAAARALSAGRHALAAVREPGAAQRTRADLNVAEAQLRRATAPQSALTLLEEAERAYAQSNLQIYLPETELERGRTFLALHDEESAARAFERSIAMLLSQRERITSTTLRAGLFDNATGMFDEALRLALRHNNAAHAFRIVELARARTLLDEIAARTHGPVRVPSPGELQAVLRDGTFLQLTVLPEKVIAVVFAGGTFRTYTVSITALRLDDEIDKLTNGMSRHQSEEAVESAAAHLFDSIIAPASVRPGTPLVISADGALQRIPWAALWNRTRRSYLVEDHLLMVVPSAAVFVANSVRAAELGKAAPQRALIIGEPEFDRAMFPQLPVLRSSRIEMQNIRAQYKNSDSWSGSGATRSRFIASAPDYQIVHFAGHAVAGLARGEDSFLVFAATRATPETGLLYSSSVSEINFATTRLVVLATCSSLRGTTRGKEGMPSIARAFLAAGVPAVAGTLWDVDDEASTHFFTILHRYLSAGTSPETALRETQLYMLHSGNADLKHPATWAATQLSGGWSRNP